MLRRSFPCSQPAIAKNRKPSLRELSCRKRAQLRQARMGLPEDSLFFRAKTRKFPVIEIGASGLKRSLARASKPTLTALTIVRFAPLEISPQTKTATTRLSGVAAAVDRA